MNIFKEFLQNNRDTLEYLHIKPFNTNILHDYLPTMTNLTYLKFTHGLSLENYHLLGNFTWNILQYIAEMEDLEFLSLLSNIILDSKEDILELHKLENLKYLVISMKYSHCYPNGGSDEDHSDHICEHNFLKYLSEMTQLKKLTLFACHRHFLDDKLDNLHNMSNLVELYLYYTIGNEEQDEI